MQTTSTTANGLLNRQLRSNGNWMWRRLRSSLETGDPACTMDRLFASKHVRDLQLLVAVALSAVFLVFVLGLVISVVDELANNWRAFGSDPWGMAALRMGKHLFLGIASFLTFFGPVLALLVGVLAWTYQVGSARLGVVDLFACEIDTICRVVTVFDAVKRYVDGFNQAPTTRPEKDERTPRQHFSSQESYFPVFENNTEELQALEARVVINITAFYTYMKALRDSLRARDDIMDKTQSSSAWQDATRNVIYMMFLGLESARHAITDLVEFEPENAERRIVVLMSELEAYGFLRQQYQDEKDVHYQRITLRDPEYRKLIPELCEIVEFGKQGLHKEAAHAWEPAWRLLPELRKRYEKAVTNPPSLPGRTIAVAAE